MGSFENRRLSALVTVQLAFSLADTKTTWPVTVQRAQGTVIACGPNAYYYAIKIASGLCSK